MRRVAARRLRDACRCRHLADARCAQHERQHDHDDALADAEPQERRLVAAGGDHVLDRDDGERRSRAEARRGQSGGEAAPVGEPFQRVADAGAVDRAGPDAADRGGDIEEGQRIGDRVHRPGDADQHAADQHDDLGAEAIDEPALDRHQPGLRQHEDAERHLDRGPAPVVLLVDRVDEQRPAVLQVGDHHHADDADHELQPTGGRRLNRTAVRHRNLPDCFDWCLILRPCKSATVRSPGCGDGIRKRKRPEGWSGPLEVDPLDHRQALEVSAQAVEPQFDRAEPQPFASAQDARAPEGNVLRRSDRDPDGAAEIYPIRSLVKIDQYHQCVRRAGVSARGTCHRLGGFLGRVRPRATFAKCQAPCAVRCDRAR